MAESSRIDIAISAKDNFSTTLKTITGNTTAFGKEMKTLQKKLDALNNTKLKLKTEELPKAKKAAQDAAKGIKDLTDEVVKNKAAMAENTYDNVKSNLKAVQKEINATEQAMYNLTKQSKKKDNSAGGGSILGKLGESGLKNMVGQALSTAVNAGITSAFGDEAGTVIGSTLSGAASGAAIGSTIPGVGTVIGAAVGAATGVITGTVQNFQKADDAFKSVVQEEYTRVDEAYSGKLSAGSTLAGQRETDKIAFSKLLGGADISADYLSWVKDTANDTPFYYDELTSMSKIMASYRYSVDEMKKLIYQVGDTGAAMGMDASDMSMLVTALGRMKSSGKTTLEYLNIIIERGVPAIQYLSEALGKSQGEIYDMVSKGLIPGAEAAQIIADSMGEDFAGSMVEISKTFEGLTSTSEGLAQDLNAAMGEGFNQKRNEGLSSQIEFYSGEMKSQMEEAYKMMGEFEASLINQQEEIWRQCMTEAMESDEYRNAIAENNGAEAGRILKEAEVKAENEYRQSEGYQLMLQTDRDMVNNLRSELSGDWYNYGYTMQKEFNKGRLSVITDAMNADKKIASAASPAANYGLGGSGYQVPNVKGKAFGMSYVPYDNYPALLHEGERVLTARENRSYNGGSGGIQINISGNVIREETDIDKIAETIVVRLKEAREGYVSA